jgi:hypothetical protein
MADMIIAKYSSKGPVANAYDDLVSAGIPREKIRIDEDRHAISVVTPAASDSEITEILRRHQPVELKTRQDAPA